MGLNLSKSLHSRFSRNFISKGISAKNVQTFNRPTPPYSMTNIKSTFFQGRSAPYAANCYSWLKSITPLNTIQDPQSDVEKPYCGRQCPDLLIRPPVYNPYDILVHMSLSYPFGTQVTSLIVGIQSTTWVLSRFVDHQFQSIPG